MNRPTGPPCARLWPGASGPVPAPSPRPSRRGRAGLGQTLHGPPQGHRRLLPRLVAGELQQARGRVKAPSRLSLSARNASPARWLSQRQKARLPPAPLPQADSTLHSGPRTLTVRRPKSLGDPVSLSRARPPSQPCGWWTPTSAFTGPLGPIHPNCTLFPVPGRGVGQGGGRAELLASVPQCPLGVPLHTQRESPAPAPGAAPLGAGAHVQERGDGRRLHTAPESRATEQGVGSGQTPPGAHVARVRPHGAPSLPSPRHAQSRVNA